MAEEYGLTSTGYKRRRLEGWLEVLKQDFKNEFGDAFLTSDDSLPGKLIAIMANRLDTLEEAQEAIYFSEYPSTAGGVSLDRVGEFTGHIRQGASKSTVLVYLAGSSGTVISAGSLLSVDQTQDFFKTSDIATLGSIGSVDVISVTHVAGLVTVTTTDPHGFNVNDTVFIVGANEPEYNGLFSISNITNDTTFEYNISGNPTSPATGTIVVKEATSVECESVTTGPIQALAGTLTNIETPVSGWELAENATDATLGRNEETDSEFRERRGSTLTQLAGGHLPAIKSGIENVTGVTSVSAFSNDTGWVDSEGRPPHSVEAFVQGGEDQAIADQLFNLVSGGIETYGNTSMIVTDTDNNDHTIKFSRLVPIAIYVDVTISINSNPAEGPIFPADGNTQIVQAIVDYGNSLAPGQDVPVTPYLMSAVASVQGILTIDLKADTVDPPVNTNKISIGITEIADFDSSRITVTLS